MSACRLLARALKLSEQVGGLATPTLSFAAQNCNSLNISTNCGKQLKKISSILSLNTTFIFLSDIRLGNKQSVEDLEKTFSCNPTKNYNFYHNSCNNKRGVGILIDHNLNYNVLNDYRDPDNNILGMHIEVSDFSIWIISIYGPNNNDAIFFDRLRNLTRNAGTTPVLIGGDWNTTVCTINSPDNIDILNMQSPPSHFRSLRLQELMYEGKLTDPFRALWPDKRDFTYTPRTGRANRSRLDFFLISDTLLNSVTDSYSSETILSSLFDHKAIFMCLGQAVIHGSSSIFNSTVNHPRFNDIVLTSIIDSYLNHADPDPPDADVIRHNLG
jgi:exonuclease III